MSRKKRSSEAAESGDNTSQNKARGKKENSSTLEKSVDSETAVLHKSKKRIIIPVCIIVAAAILFSGGYLFYQNTPERVIARSQAKAAVYAEEKDYGAAAAELEKILELDDKNIQAYLDISLIYIEQNMTDKAVQILQKGYELTNDGEIKTRLDELLKEQALEQGNKFLSENDYQKAAEEFQKVLDIDKKCIEAYIGKTEAYTKMNETDKAIQCLQSGIDETDSEELKTKLDEIKVKQLLENADKLYAQNEYDEARKEYKNVLVIDGENVKAYLGMAYAFLAMDNEDSAIEILNAGFEKTKDSQIEEKLNEIQLSVYLKAAEQYLDDEEYESAQRELKKALGIDSKCIKAYLTFAEICGYTEQIDEAVELLQEGFDNTSDEEIKTKLQEYKVLQCLNNAEEYLYDEEYDKAKDEYEKVLEMDKQCAEAYLGLADYYGRTGNQEEAANILEMGLEITEDEDIAERLEQIQISSMLWQASSYYNEGDYAAAAEEYGKVLELDPYYADAYLGAANAYVRLNRNDDAIDILQTGYNYTWNNTILSRLIQLRKEPHLNLANKYLSSRNYSDAAEEFRTVLGIDYYCTEAYIGLAEAYVGLGRMSWADETLSEGYDATGSKEIEVKMFEVRLNYVSLSSQKTSYEPLNSLVQQILSQITTSRMSTYQKVMACYDYLVDNCRYGQASDSYFNAGDTSNERLYAEKSAYAVLHGKVGICLNYSAAFAAMTRALGLKTQLRTGQTTAYGGGYTSHTWCEITLNGVVYVFDPQVDDNILTRGDAVEYSRFCRPYSEVSVHYIPEAYIYMF